MPARTARTTVPPGGDGDPGPVDQCRSRGPTPSARPRRGGAMCAPVLPRPRLPVVRDPGRGVRATDRRGRRRRAHRPTQARGTPARCEPVPRLAPRRAEHAGGGRRRPGPRQHFRHGLPAGGVGGQAHRGLIAVAHPRRHARRRDQDARPAVRRRSGPPPGGMAHHPPAGPRRCEVAGARLHPRYEPLRSGYWPEEEAFRAAVDA
jgi:hypothetical protein